MSESLIQFTAEVNINQDSGNDDKRLFPFNIGISLRDWFKDLYIRQVAGRKYDICRFENKSKKNSKERKK